MASLFYKVTCSVNCTMTELNSFRLAYKYLHELIMKHFFVNRMLKGPIPSNLVVHFTS